MKRIALHVVVLVVGIWLCPPATAAAIETNAVVTAWLGSQASIRTLTADLIQTRKLKALADPLVTKGRLWFEPPDRFRWELGVPAQTIVVRDGKDLLMISPRLKRVERYPMDGSAKGPWTDALSLLESGFPRDAASFHRQYHVRSLAETNGVFEFRIQPASPGARRMITGILLVVGTNDFGLQASELSLADGSVVRNDFGNVRLNAKLETNTFAPAITADFKIVEPWKKQP